MKELIENIVFGIKPNEIEVELKFELMSEPTEIPKGSGLYMIMGGTEILYIGETTSLRKRIQQHMSGSHLTEKFKSEWTHILITTTGMNKNIRTLSEALLIEKYDPKYNTSDTKRLIASYGNMETVKDLVYYLRVASLEFEYVAEEFGLKVETCKNFAKGLVATNVMLDKNFVPNKRLDLNRTRATKSNITKKLFYVIYDYIHSQGHTQADAIRKFDIPVTTAYNVANIKTAKYERWIQEREEGKLTTV